MNTHAHGYLGVLDSRRPLGVEYFQNGSSPTAVAYTQALTNYRAHPAATTYQAARAAYQADHELWLIEQERRARTVAAHEQAYAAALTEHQQAMKQYTAALLQYNVANTAALQAQRAQDAYPTLMGKWRAEVERVTKLNQRHENECAGARATYDRYRADWQREYAAWQSAVSAYQLAVRQRTEALARLNAPVVAKWGGSMPSGYPGCLADTVRAEYERRCAARFIEGLGAFPANAILETSGPWTGVPICMLAELPKCSAAPKLPAPPPSVGPQPPEAPVCKGPIPLPAAPPTPPPSPAVPPEPKPPAKPPAPDPLLPLRPEPKPPDASLMRAAGGLRVSGLLLVAIVAGGGFAAYKLTRKKKPK